MENEKKKVKMNLPKRIYIIGTMGSGKTTLAKKLSHITKIKNYPLDNIYYSRKYDKKRKHDIRERKLNKLLEKKNWIIEGVFNNWTEDIFKTADLVIWLDLHPPHLIVNLLKRFFKKEDEKANFKNIKESMKYAVGYRKGSKKFIWHKTMLEKHKTNLIHIKTKRQLNKFLRELK